MGIIDKLKGTPKWKHQDLAVRLEGLKETDDPAVFAEALETDTEARVRRVAVGRVDDVAVLAQAAQNDADEDVRDKAAERLVSLATDAGRDEALAASAAAGVSDQKKLSTIVKTSPHASARAAALARVTDTRALGSIARHAKDETSARAAFDRIADRDELTNVALKSDHKDLALAAFDRVIDASAPDRALLETLESRSQQKAVSKRARTLMQHMDEAEATRIKAAEEQARREQQITDAIEQVAQIADVARAETELARLTDVWTTLGAASDAGAARFADVVSRANSAIDAKRRDAADKALQAARAAEEEVELARSRAEAVATREALLTRVETLVADTPEHLKAQLNAIEEEWRSLAPLVGNGPEASRLAERFAVAVAACRTRHEMGAELDTTRAKLDALVTEAETLPAMEETPAADRWRTLVREARGLATVLKNAGRPADDLKTRLDAVAAVFAGRDALVKEAATKTLDEQLVKLQRMSDRAKRVAEAEQITLREGERLMKDVRTALDEASAIDRKDFREAAATLTGWLEKVAPRVRDLREMDDWRRFANQQAQDRLILEAETLVAKLALEEQHGQPSDLAAASRKLRDLHGKWKLAAEAPRDQAQKLWERFRTATDLIRLRCEVYFKQVREARTASLSTRTALVEEAESLVNSTDWVKTATRFQELQKAWQDAGPMLRGGDGPDPARDLMKRFRAASNAFFSRRREDLTTRKKVWGDNQSKKEALCARAEELAQSTDWDAASAEMKKLQAEWKTVGPLRRAKSEALWTRFRAAADNFFERYHHRHEIALAGKIAEREEWLATLEGIAATDGDAPEGLAEKIQTLRTTWNRAVPIPTAEFRALVDRWQKTLASVIAKWPDAFKGTDVDPAAAITRMEKLVTRLETLLEQLNEGAPEPKKALSPTELLAQKLRSALAQNAMGGRSTDDSKWRSAADTLKDAQASWQRLPPVPGDQAAALQTKFAGIARKIGDLVRKNQPSHSGGGGKPSGGHQGGGGGHKGGGHDKRPQRTPAGASA
ncbi:MAG: DUF349 domain-containing protein [Acidobacteria bacterium]|nr:MAG: DUF349 domain-containing protein [Acidobacteriota bacterium]